MGGHLADIPEPHIRKFPNPFVKREVKITISRYYGYGEHYYVSVKEESNPIWNGSTWVDAWDDKEGKGLDDLQLYFDRDEKEARISAMAYELAIGKAKMILKKYFPDHQVKWDDYCKDWEAKT